MFKIVAKVFFIFVAYLIMIQISLKVFNRVDAWIGIAAGFVSTCAFIYALYVMWKRTGADGKEKEKKE